MNNKKEREREELHKTIWKIANELRGSVDGWDFKQYVLGLLFYRFISENIENYVNDNQRKAGITDFQYRNISDEEALLGKSQILDEKGFFILPSELFCNIRKAGRPCPCPRCDFHKGDHRKRCPTFPACRFNPLFHLPHICHKIALSKQSINNGNSL